MIAWPMAVGGGARSAVTSSPGVSAGALSAASGAVSSPSSAPGERALVSAGWPPTASTSLLPWLSRWSGPLPSANWKYATPCSRRLKWRGNTAPLSSKAMRMLNTCPFSIAPHTGLLLDCLRKCTTSEDVRHRGVDHDAGEHGQPLASQCAVLIVAACFRKYCAPQVDCKARSGRWLARKLRVSGAFGFFGHTSTSQASATHRRSSGSL
jgi:hypothetical protein